MGSGGAGLGGEVPVGRRAMRAAGAIAVISLLALGVRASAASAEPLSMTFTESRANVGVQLSDAPLFEAPATAPFAAQIDPGSGAIAAGDLTVPDFSTHITDPLNADVTVEFKIGIITGSFVQATGALSLSGEAGGKLTANGGECIVSTVPPVLALSTAGSSGGTSPRSGTPFTAGLTGPGAIAGQWSDMNATPVSSGDKSVCETVDERIGGVGGVWLGQKGNPMPPSAPPLVGDPAPAACVVPKLKGKSLRRARTVLRAAHCRVGKVREPRRRRGRKAGPLVVKASNPAAGKTLKAGGEVNLKLGEGPLP